MRNLITATISALALALGLAGPSAADHVIVPGFLNGAVFVATNSVDQPGAFPRGNEIVMYRMDKSGALTLRGRFPTGGQGSGPGTSHRANSLGSANSLVLSANEKWLFATNAGSDSLSFFHVNPEGLTLIDHVKSGGSFPNSVAVRGNLVYVLNAGGDGNITGFRIIGGHLVPIADSTRELGAGGVPGEPPDAFASPAQVSFTPDGTQLVITIKDGIGPPTRTTDSGLILVFPLDPNGLPSKEPVVTPSSGAGPFGFDFDDNGNLFVAELFGGPNGTGAVSSYRILGDGTLEPISPSVSGSGFAPCWLDVAGNFGWGANFDGDTISSYAIGADGSLRLLEAVAGKTEEPESFNLDLRSTRDGKFLYNLLPGVGRIALWEVGEDGGLTSLGEFNALEPSPDSDPTDPFGPGGSPAGLAVAVFAGPAEAH